jgi:hypothetical protein
VRTTAITLGRSSLPAGICVRSFPGLRVYQSGAGDNRPRVYRGVTVTQSPPSRFDRHAIYGHLVGSPRALLADERGNRAHEILKGDHGVYRGLWLGKPVAALARSVAGTSFPARPTAASSAESRPSAAAATNPDSPLRVPKYATVYQCPSCDRRYLGEQRCEDCNVFARRVGPGGSCPHCDEPVAVTDLVEEVAG